MNSEGWVDLTTVQMDERGNVVTHVPVRIRRFHQVLPTGAALPLVFLPEGSFRMGNTSAWAEPDERPAHTVHVNACFLSQTAVTQQQWQAVMGALPPCRGHGQYHPVDRVTWYAAQAFCERLAHLTQLPYRLPSEAEWEYACRAGSTSEFAFGDTLTTDVANYVGWHVFGQGPKGEYRHGPVAVGSFWPNAWGLYDMHGNVAEWCADSWHDTYDHAPTDGRAWVDKGTTARVVRGGSWHDPPHLCRSSARLRMQPSEGEDFIGVRVALSA